MDMMDMKKLKCAICGKPFSHEKNFLKHIKGHTDPVCPTNLEISSNIQNHLSTRTVTSHSTTIKALDIVDSTWDMILRKDTSNISSIVCDGSTLDSTMPSKPHSEVNNKQITLAEVLRYSHASKEVSCADGNSSGKPKQDLYLQKKQLHSHRKLLNRQKNSCRVSSGALGNKMRVKVSQGCIRKNVTAKKDEDLQAQLDGKSDIVKLTNKSMKVVKSVPGKSVVKAVMGKTPRYVRINSYNHKMAKSSLKELKVVLCDIMKLNPEQLSGCVQSKLMSKTGDISCKKDGVIKPRSSHETGSIKQKGSVSLNSDNSKGESVSKCSTVNIKFKCSICGRWFYQKKVLIKHLNLHDVDMTSGSAILNQSHAKVVPRHLGHNEIESCVAEAQVTKAQNGCIAPVYDVKSELYPCSHCGRSFHQSVSLLRHVATHHVSEDSFENECRKTSSGVSSSEVVSTGDCEDRSRANDQGNANNRELNQVQKGMKEEDKKEDSSEIARTENASGTRSDSTTVNLEELKNEACQDMVGGSQAINDEEKSRNRGETVSSVTVPLPPSATLPKEGIVLHVEVIHGNKPVTDIQFKESEKFDSVEDLKEDTNIISQAAYQTDTEDKKPDIPEDKEQNTVNVASLEDNDCPKLLIGGMAPVRQNNNLTVSILEEIAEGKLGILENSSATTADVVSEATSRIVSDVIKDSKLQVLSDHGIQEDGERTERNCMSDAVQKGIAKIERTLGAQGAQSIMDNKEQQSEKPNDVDFNTEATEIELVTREVQGAGQVDNTENHIPREDSKANVAGNVEKVRSSEVHEGQQNVTMQGNEAKKMPENNLLSTSHNQGNFASSRAKGPPANDREIYASRPDYLSQVETFSEGCDQHDSNVASSASGRDPISQIEALISGQEVPPSHCLLSNAYNFSQQSTSNCHGLHTASPRPCDVIGYPAQSSSRPYPVQLARNPVTFGNSVPVDPQQFPMTHQYTTVPCSNISSSQSHVMRRNMSMHGSTADWNPAWHSQTLVAQNNSLYAHGTNQYTIGYDHSVSQNFPQPSANMHSQNNAVPVGLSYNHGQYYNPASNSQLNSRANSPIPQSGVIHDIVDFRFSSILMSISSKRFQMVHGRNKSQLFPPVSNSSFQNRCPMQSSGDSFRQAHDSGIQQDHSSNVHYRWPHNPGIQQCHSGDHSRQPHDPVIQQYHSSHGSVLQQMQSSNDHFSQPHTPSDQQYHSSHGSVPPPMHWNRSMPHYGINSQPPVTYNQNFMQTMPTGNTEQMPWVDPTPQNKDPSSTITNATAQAPQSHINQFGAPYLSERNAWGFNSAQFANWPLPPPENVSGGPSITCALREQVAGRTEPPTTHLPAVCTTVTATIPTNGAIGNPMSSSYDSCTTVLDNNSFQSRDDDVLVTAVLLTKKGLKRSAFHQHLSTTLTQDSVHLFEPPSKAIKLDLGVSESPGTGGNGLIDEEQGDGQVMSNGNQSHIADNGNAWMLGQPDDEHCQRPLQSDTSVHDQPDDVRCQMPKLNASHQCIDSSSDINVGSSFGCKSGYGETAVISCERPPTAATPAVWINIEPEDNRSRCTAGYKGTHSARNFQCDICLKKFAEQRSVQKHKRVVHGTSLQTITRNNNFKCDICEKQFSTEKERADHKDSHSFDETQNAPKGISSDQESTSCGKRDDIDCIVISEDQDHSDAHRSLMPCLKCKKLCTSGDVKEKWHIFEQIELQKLIDKKKIECCVCEKSFPTLKYLRQHYTTHTRPHVCSKCDKGFFKKCHLNMHITNSPVHTHIVSEDKDQHHSDRLMQCLKCGKLCHSEIEQHGWHIFEPTKLQKLFDKKCIECCVCGTPFSRIQSLQQHHKTHSRPYICSKNEYASHQQSMPGNYKCYVCHKMYSSFATLQVHVHIHTGQDQFECGKYKQSFSDSDEHKIHLISSEAKDIGQYDQSIESDVPMDTCAMANPAKSQEGNIQDTSIGAAGHQDGNNVSFTQMPEMPLSQTSLAQRTMYMKNTSSSGFQEEAMGDVDLYCLIDSPPTDSNDIEESDQAPENLLDMASITEPSMGLEEVPDDYFDEQGSSCNDIKAPDIKDTQTESGDHCEVPEEKNMSYIGLAELPNGSSDDLKTSTADVAYKDAAHEDEDGQAKCEDQLEVAENRDVSSTALAAAHRESVGDKRISLISQDESKVPNVGAESGQAANGNQPEVAGDGNVSFSIPNIQPGESSNQWRMWGTSFKSMKWFKAPFSVYDGPAKIGQEVHIKMMRKTKSISEGQVKSVPQAGIKMTPKTKSVPTEDADMISRERADSNMKREACMLMKRTDTKREEADMIRKREEADKKREEADMIRKREEADKKGEEADMIRKREEADKKREEADLKKHLKTHTGERPFSCEICGQVFNQTESLAYHMMMHKDETPVQGELCGRHFRTNGHLNRHVKSHSTEPKVPRKKRQCDICGKHVYYLSVHRRIHEDPKFVCEKCGKRFRAKEALQLHLNKCGKQPYSCKECGVHYRIARDLKNHMLAHTGQQKKYRCDSCEMSFDKKSVLGRHAKLHTTDRPFKCEFCPSTFIQKYALTRHLVSHKVFKESYPCSLCSQAFVMKKDLVKHQEESHAGETVKKVFTCGTCGKTYSTKSLLRNHLKRKHPADVNLEENNPEIIQAKGFSCCFCGKSFRTDQLLMKHEESNHLDESSEDESIDLDDTEEEGEDEEEDEEVDKDDDDVEDEDQDGKEDQDKEIVNEEDQLQKNQDQNTSKTEDEDKDENKDKDPDENEDDTTTENHQDQDKDITEDKNQRRIKTMMDQNNDAIV